MRSLFSSWLMRVFFCVFFVVHSAQSNTNFQTDSYDVFYGDVNNDGHNDLYLRAVEKWAIISSSIDFPIPFKDAESVLLPGDGQGGFGSPIDYTQRNVNVNGLSQGVYDLVIEDIDGDRRNDLYFDGQRTGRNSVVVYGSASSDVPTQMDVIDLQGIEVPGATSSKFEVSNGVASLNVPFPIPQGRGGMQPDLSVTYSSDGNSNGVLGLGWNLTGLSAITRCAATYAQDDFPGAINFDNNDRYCLDGQRLIPISGVNGGVGAEYRTELNNYSKIVSVGGSRNNPSYFIVRTKAGHVMEYGRGNNSVVNTPSGRLTWAVSEINDTTSNNPIEFNYTLHSNNQYLSNIDYAGGRVTLDYESRPDPISTYFKGAMTRMERRLTRVNIYSSNELIRRFHFTYQSGTYLNRSLLSKITECDSSIHCFKPIDLSWSQDNYAGMSEMNTVPAWVMNDQAAARVDISRIKFADFNGDGITDVYRVLGYGSQPQTDVVYLMQSNGQYREVSGINSHVHGNLGDASVDIARIRFGDFNGDGNADIYYFRGKGSSVVDHIYFSRGDGTFSGPVNALNTYVGSNKESGLFELARAKFGDFNADGRTDIYYVNGFGTNEIDDIYISNGNGSFSRENGLNTFVSRKNIATGNVFLSSIILSDFNGDRRTDVYYVNGFDNDDPVMDHIHLYMGNGQFDTYNSISTVVGKGLAKANFNMSRIHFGDFNGDGNVDIYHMSLGEDTLDSIHLSRGVGKGFSRVDGLTTSIGGIVPFHVPNPNDPIAPDADEIYEAASINTSRFKFHDFNGDGKTDIYEVKGFQSSSNIDVLHIAHSNGVFIPERGENTDINSSSHGVSELDISRLMFADLTGDGSVDLFRVEGWGNHVANKLYKNLTSHTRIDQMTDSNQNITRIRYLPLSDSSIYTKANDASYPVRDMQGSQFVVRDVRTGNGVGGENRVSYQYQGLKVHMLGRGSYGYGQIRETHHHSGKITETNYNQSGFPYIGNVSQQRELYNNVVLNESTNQFSSRQTHTDVFAVDLSESIQRSRELNNNIVSTVTTRHSNIDAFGNVRRIEVVTTDGTETFRKITVSEFSNDQAHWLLGRLDTSTVTHRSPGQVDDVRTSRFTYAYMTGLLATESVVSSVSNQPLITTTYGYDQYGHKASVTVSASGETTRTSLTQFNTEGKPTRRCNVYNECETLGYTAEGRLERTTGPNGLTTRWEYDDFGRKTAEHRADGPAPALNTILFKILRVGRQRVMQKTV